MTRKIATQDIYAAPGVRAFSAGDVVPDSVVEALGLSDKVSGEGTKAAAAVTPAPTPAPKAPAGK